MKSSSHDVIVVGAGFAGLYAVHRLRNELGLSVRCIEAGSEVGGTWFWNRYPGARCDTESHVYCYSFSRELWEEWEWSGKYPLQAELLAYLQHVADRFDLRRSISLGTRLVSAHWSDLKEGWVCELDDGTTAEARFLVTGVGLLASAPYTPDFSGIDVFRGLKLHTGLWPKEDVDFTDKRVAIIGTGSTGVQATPVVAKSAKTLTVLQRSPQYAVPAQHHTLTPSRRQELKSQYDAIWKAAKWSNSGFPWSHNGRSVFDDTPQQRQEHFEQLWAEGGLRFVLGSYRDILTDLEANRMAANFARKKIAERVKDSEVREHLLAIDHPIGGRRPIVETDYYETFNKSHVDLVDLKRDPIVAFTRDGIQMAMGERKFDIVIFATGFDAVTGPFLRMDLRGRDGMPLADKWSNGPISHMGLVTSRFPNFFTITGPGSTFGNLPVSIEHHVDWIANCLDWMRQRRFNTVEVTPSAEDAWMSQLLEAASKNVSAGVGSWWNGANIPGKPQTPLFYLGSFGKYRRLVDSVADAGYRGFIFS